MVRGLPWGVRSGQITPAFAAPALPVVVLLALVLLVAAPTAGAEDGTTTTATIATTTAAAATTTTPVTTADGAPPCVGAGLLAVVAPAGGAPTAAGPSVAAVERTGAETPTFADPSGLASASTVQVGGAGCRDAAGTPGGTAVSTGAWSVLSGAVSGQALKADLVPAAAPPGAGWTLRATVTDLRIGGRPASLEAGQSLPVGAWGVLSVQGRVDAGAGQPLRWWASALELRLTAAHAGLPAGTTLLIGYAAADRVAEAPPPAPPAPTTTAAPAAAPAAASPPSRGPKATVHAPKQRTAPKRHRTKKQNKPKRGQPLKVTPPLGGAVYDFPLYGQVDWGDSYGGARSDVPGGWHHGDDLFASLGRPVVAVADGTVFAVGWNGVGGWRVWLRDEEGNQFYYAHLSGYTKLARNGAHVKRGQVLGFVGNTGDAFTTPDHLHFEIHPAGLLYLGYDGAVDPSTYLAHGRHPARVARLQPVALPDRRRHGDGALADYRQLLALHGLARGAAAEAAALPKIPLVPSQPLRLPPHRLAAPALPAVEAAAATTGDSGGLAAGAAAGAAVLALGCVVGVGVLRRRRAPGDAS
jgi:murein DD-endopeptidase MepM/ murein hydrolase activator NlpD